jgi:hypothetical protein
MEHLNAVRAALRGSAPVVAIPVPGHAPVCIRAKLLKGALKGVTIDTVEVVTREYEYSGTRVLKITGHHGSVHTSSTFFPMARGLALQLIGEWSYRERQKRKVIALKGVLSAAEQRALKLKQAEQAGIAELIEARKVEAEILSSATVCPVLTPVSEERRQDIIESYAAFRCQRGIRKRASVIRWTLAKLRKEKAAMVKNQCEYEVTYGYGRRRKHLKSKKLVLRNPKNAVKYAALIYQIGELEKQYESLSLREWVSYSWQCEDGERKGYWRDSWITKHPKEQTYTVSRSWRNCYIPEPEQVDENGEVYLTGIKLLAWRLKNARADIRALTPPEDEETTQEQIAA